VFLPRESSKFTLGGKVPGVHFLGDWVSPTKRSEPPEKPKMPAIRNGLLSVVGTVRRRNGAEALVGADGQLFRRTEGAVTALTPFDLGKEYGVKKSKGGVLISWDRKAQPPDWAVRWIYEKTIRDYEHEVVVVVGRKPDGQWVFVLPEQEASPGEAEWKDDQAIPTLWDVGAEYCGSLHSHPGSWVSASDTDMKEYKDASGVHLIVSKQGDRVGCYVSAGRCVWALGEHELNGTERPNTPEPLFLTSGGRSRETLLKVRSVCWETAAAADWEALVRPRGMTTAKEWKCQGFHPKRLKRQKRRKWRKWLEHREQSFERRPTIRAEDLTVVQAGADCAVSTWQDLQPHDDVVGELTVTIRRLLTDGWFADIVNSLADCNADALSAVEDQLLEGLCGSRDLPSNEDIETWKSPSSWNDGGDQLWGY